MKIYSEKMEVLREPDLSSGWLETRTQMVHHAAIKAVEEIWHHEVIAEYPNGGRDVRRVIDRPGIEGRDAWNEQVRIQIYHPYTIEERTNVEQKPTIEERVDKLENVMELLTSRIDVALQQWKELTAREGAQ